MRLGYDAFYLLVFNYDYSCIDKPSSLSFYCNVSSRAYKLFFACLLLLCVCVVYKKKRKGVGGERRQEYFLVIESVL